MDLARSGGCVRSIAAAEVNLDRPRSGQLDDCQLCASSAGRIIGRWSRHRTTVTNPLTSTCVYRPTVIRAGGRHASTVQSTRKGYWLIHASSADRAPRRRIERAQQPACPRSTRLCAHVRARQPPHGVGVRRDVGPNTSDLAPERQHDRAIDVVLVDQVGLGDLETRHASHVPSDAGCRSFLGTESSTWWLPSVIAAYLNCEHPTSVMHDRTHHVHACGVERLAGADSHHRGPSWLRPTRSDVSASASHMGTGVRRTRSWGR